MYTVFRWKSKSTKIHKPHPFAGVRHLGRFSMPRPKQSFSILLKRTQGTISERSSRHCLLSGRQKTTLRHTTVLRNGSVFPLCRGQTLNFGGGRSTWNDSSASRDGHHIWDGHTGTRSTAAGRSARSLQRTSGNKTKPTVGSARRLRCSSRSRVHPLPRPLE